MKTLVKNNGDTLVVSMDGRLDFETYIPLRENLLKLAKASVSDKKIIMDLENLEFVGSSGISAFIQILKEFNQNSPTKPRYCNVGSEFKKMIKSMEDGQVFEFFDSEVSDSDVEC